jgi:NADP-dependent 3-hydroxy acid dehydrogenase YdfG
MVFWFFIFIALCVLYIWSYGHGRKMRGSKSKVILVTGAGSGIGLETTRKLLQSKCSVIATDVRISQQLEALQVDYAEHLRIWTMDVTSDSDVAEARNRLADEKLFAIVNNAGIAACSTMFKGIGEISPKECKVMFDVNVFGVLRVTEAFLGALEKDAGDEMPAVVNIASVAGIVSTAFVGLYTATKFAVKAISDTLRREQRYLGVRVCTIAPGFVKTPLLDLFDTTVYDKSVSPLADIAKERHARAAAKLFVSLQTPQDVARVIVDDAVLRRRPVPFIVVDRPVLRCFYRIMAVLPERIVDTLEALV